jgi:hypothetical protein
MLSEIFVRAEKSVNYTILYTNRQLRQTSNFSKMVEDAAAYYRYL